MHTTDTDHPDCTEWADLRRADSKFSLLHRGKAGPWEPLTRSKGEAMVPAPGKDTVIVTSIIF